MCLFCGLTLFREVLFVCFSSATYRIRFGDHELITGRGKTITGTSQKFFSSSKDDEQYKSYYPHCDNRQRQQRHTQRYLSLARNHKKDGHILYQSH